MIPLLDPKPRDQTGQFIARWCQFCGTVNSAHHPVSSVLVFRCETLRQAQQTPVQGFRLWLCEPCWLGWNVLPPAERFDVMESTSA